MNFEKSTILQTGGVALGEINTRSTYRPQSDFTQRDHLIQNSPTIRTSLARMFVNLILITQTVFPHSEYVMLFSSIFSLVSKYTSSGRKLPFIYHRINFFGNTKNLPFSCFLAQRPVFVRSPRCFGLFFSNYKHIRYMTDVVANLTTYLLVTVIHKSRIHTILKQPFT